MAIEYTLLLKDKKLSEKILVKKIESVGYSCNMCEQLTRGICINLDKEIGFSVFLLDAGDYPYNLWETHFTEKDFRIEKILEFQMVKEYSKLEKRYDVMLKILFDLVAELNEEGILLSNWSTELCFFRENETTLLNNESGIWNRRCFKDIIVNRDVCYIK